ncbi:DNA polymerase III subunit gamma/tau [Patescibacteria group bacterium]
MSFYRIYRPQKLEEIDTVDVRNQLINLLTKETKNLPHAYLFSGPKGTGKTTAARLIAKIFNCEKLSTQAGPCGKCVHCDAIAKGTSLDVQEIDAASNRGIDEIRQLREKIGFTPSSSNFTVYIIDEVHMLTTEAFNGLLKTLEEPPKHAVFVLATTQLSKVPDTIRSRCMQVTFTKANLSEITSALKKIVKKEKINIETTAMDEIVRYADGSYRDAVKVLEQLSLSKGKITLEKVHTSLTVTGSVLVKDFLDAVSQKKSKEVMDIIEGMTLSGQDIKVFITDCLLSLRDDLRDSISQKISNKRWVGDNHDIKELIRRFTVAYGELKYAPVQSLPLELAIVEYLLYVESNKKVNLPVSEAKEKVKSKLNEEKKVTYKPVDSNSQNNPAVSGLITVEKLSECWPDIINEIKPFNHSIAGILRSARPNKVADGKVTIEAFYKFHQEKLSESKVKDILSQVFKKLFGEKVSVEIVLGKK